MTEPSKSFSGKCPSCGGYDSRIRTEVINYAVDQPIDKPDRVDLRTRIFACNTCKYVWTETVRK